ncbi:MAG: trigger factor [Lachnospiraceae bacterium]
MRKTGRGLSVVMAMTMAMGLLAGCGNGKVKDVSFTYNAGEYVQLGEYKGIEITVDDYTVKDEDLQNVIDQIREKKVRYNVVEREAKDKDLVNLSFSAYISGVKVEGFSSNDYKAVIGSNQFLVDGFEEALIGLKAGDTRAITGLRIPENFAQEASYAGRAVTFNVEILGVYEPELPEYNDAFVIEVTGGEYTNVSDYNASLMEQLQENAETNRYNDKYNKVLDKIVENSTVLKDFPEEYIASKSEGIQTEVDKYKVLSGQTDEEYLMQYYGVSTVEEAAKNQILLEFIFQQIIVNENLKVTQKYYDEHLTEASETRNYSSPEKFVKAFTEDGVVKCMLLDQATDIVMNSVVEK